MPPQIFAFGKAPEFPYFVIDGKVYDLTEWIPQHPGGARWFSRSNGRDISAAFHAYHKDPARLRKNLDRYEMQGEDAKVKEHTDSSLNVPPFVLPPDFDARTDVPVFEWQSKEGEGNMLADLQAQMRKPEWVERIRSADLMFDIVSVSLIIAHLCLSFPAMHYGLPAWLLVPLLVLSRTGLAAVGHYHCHRAKDGLRDWADAIFDMQYVGACLITFDGHVMLHHLYTGTDADVKRTVFTGMLELPRLWRVPIFSIVKFGNFFSGMLIRWVTFHTEAEPRKSHWPACKHLCFLLVRIILLAELATAVSAGRSGTFATQFLCTTWINLFMIVASHDFESARAEGTTNEQLSKDWAVHQVKSSMDIYVTGFQHLDLFLTAGLGCHRSHHVFPYQRSGFANIASAPLLKEYCEKYNVPWHRPRSFPLERLPTLAKHYLLAPAAAMESKEERASGQRSAGPPRLFGSFFLYEHFSPHMIYTCIEMSVLGFLGEGSI